MSFTETFSNGYLKESSDSGKMDVAAIVCRSYWRRTVLELDKDEDQDGITSTVLCA